MDLSRFPRVRLAHLPTPLEPLDALSALLGGPRLWIKRDDCTGLSTGGNKARKLEFLIGDALAQGADTIVTQGATQSNHARQTAAAAARCGLACHILLEDRTGSIDRSYALNGNVLLDRLHGATVSRRDGGVDMAAELDVACEALRRRGAKPYAIPGGGSNPIGALGYALAALEIAAQATDRGLVIDHLIHATGSAGTQAGLVAGFATLNIGIPVLGIGVRAPRARQEDMVFALADRTASLMNTPGAVRHGMVSANCDYVGEGYGIPTPEMVEAVKLLARTEGILLDPVYSGKGMAGLIDLIRQGGFSKTDTVVFLHTGGSAGLFGYPDAFELASYD